MIKELTTTNFGKLGSRTFTFPAGVTMIRGANEQGKTTLLLAMMYNWFGSSVLPFPVEEYVTWGEKGMKTQTVFIAQGQEYTCLRGTSGAELRCGDKVLATNHGPVTTKVEELLGVPPGRAETTIFAAQNEIRGVLQQGPTALAAYIEKIGDFSQIDEIIRKIGERLETGSTAPHESLLEDNKRALEGVGELLEAAETAEAAEAATAEVTRCEQALAGLKEQAARLEERRRGQRGRKQELQQQLAEGSRVQAQRRDLETKASLVPKLIQAVAEVEAQILQHSAWVTYQRFLNLPARPEVEWDGDLASLEAEQTAIKQQIAKLWHDEQLIEAQAKDRAKDRLTTTICPYTKKVCEELSDQQLIAETNAEVDADLVWLEQQRQQAQADRGEQEEELKVLDNLLLQQRKLSEQQQALGLWITIDREVVPWVAAWNGEVPAETAMPTANLNSLQAQLADVQRAASQLEVLPPVDGVRLAAIEQELAGWQDEVVEQIDLAPATLALHTAVKAKADLLHELERLTRHNDQVLWGKKRYREDIAKLEEKLGQLQHNNALLKEVKAGRLLVADLLWTKVLTGTSAYFSRMRGEDSVVTRSSKGFMINGRPLVSGSTFDILGLALRITLVKLFSQCKLLILDEANAGADEDRTALMLGTLATAGFDQVLFVSHKPQDENACDHLIMV